MEAEVLSLPELWTKSVDQVKDRVNNRSFWEELESQSWDALHDYLARTWSATKMRQLPQIKARFLTDMLYVVCDAMDKLYVEPADEQTERHLARIIDKVAGSAEVPPALVALE